MFEKIEKSTIIDENAQDILFEHNEKFTGIGCFVEDFIEKAH